MKSIRVFLMMAGMIFSFHPLYAQTTQPDSIVQITADLQGLQQIAYTDLPFFGTYYEVLPGGATVPLPTPTFDPTLPIYSIAGDIYLVDATGGQLAITPRQTAMLSTNATALAQAEATALDNLIERVQAAQAPSTMAMMTMSTMDSPTPPGFGDGGTNSYSPDGLTNSYSAPDYGTNLWIADPYVAAGQLNGIGSNTVPDVEYEIQSRTNLTQIDWQHENFIWGSELTNWTPLSVPENGRTNLFLRLKSWADDGSGLPIWWQLQYFGYVGVDPNADPAGDGWSNIQKYQNGMNPNVFYTPAAPQSVSVAFFPSANQADVNWGASAGAVVGYQVEKTYELRTSDGYDYVYSTSDYSVSSTALALDNDVSAETSDVNFPSPAYNDYFKVRAKYSNGQYSGWSDTLPLKTSYLSASLVYGANGQAFLAVSGVPAGTAKIRLFYYDYDAVQYYSQPPINFSNDIPYTAFTNGIYALPDSLQPPAQDSYGPAVYGYDLIAQTVDSSNNPAGDALFFEGNSWKKPFYDGRVQLKQNLVFKLRAAGTDMPFKFHYFDTDNYPDYLYEFYDPPTNHVEASFLHITDTLYDTNSLNPYDYYAFHNTLIDSQYPFYENYIFYNFAYNSANIDGNGLLDTGVGNWNGTDLELTNVPLWKFQPPSGTWTSVAGLLDSSHTGWICSVPLDGSTTISSQLGENDVSVNGDGSYTLASNAKNLFGLAFSTEKIAGQASGNNVSLNLTPGGTSPQYTFNAGPVFYAGTAQPQLQTVEYDFWSSIPIWDSNLGRYTEDWLPGSQHFSTTNQSQQFFMSVGNLVSIAGYAKMAVQNGYSGAYAYLGQYFGNAYQVATNGVVTTNTTGILSPYGDFFATKPGPTALLTMPDVDTGAYGTCMVYTVSIALDRNQGNNMDLSFNGSDTTSQVNPMTLWVNDNYDRGHTVDSTDFEQDDLGPADVGVGHLVPDCQYTTNGQPAVPCTRDLEDYFRLWLPGVSAAMKAMPTNYSVRLTLQGGGQIRMFQAIEPNGGTNYLFDETTASNQVAFSPSLYVGLLASNSPIYLTIQTNFDEYFIFCGAQRGSAQIDLQILDGKQNVIADAPAYLQINSIKEMYERWTIGDVPTNTPATAAVLDSDGLPTNPPVPPFAYPEPQGSNTSYILLVHGWNMEGWEKDRFAETAFKRLYWQGYSGRFGDFHWPTDHDFGGIGDSWNNPVTDPRNYDNSEFTAWQSSTALTNLILRLNAEYPGHVNLIAHSMGNVVAGEALKKFGATPIVNTYVAMQAAIPSHTYDQTATGRALVYFGVSFDSGTPNCYSNYYAAGSPCYFNGSAGAETYVNFFNTNDYALSDSLWQLNQDLKPDNGFPYPGYHYDSSSGFYKINGSITTYLNFPGNTYEIFAYCDEARCYALGAQPNVGGAFKVGSAYQQVELDVPPFNFSTQHKYHSGEFRSDNMRRASFWNELLVRMKLKN